MSDNRQITHCKWCDRVTRLGAAAPDGAWNSPRDWEGRNGRLVGPLSHGICPDCVAALLDTRARWNAGSGASPARDDIEGMDGVRQRRDRDTHLRHLVERRRHSAPNAAAARVGNDCDAAFFGLLSPRQRHRYDDRAAFNRLRAILGLPPTFR